MAEKKSRVLDVGNCDPDHAMIRMILERHFDVAVDRVMFVDDALQRMRESKYDLVLFNRLIFEDQTEGLALVRKAKADPTVQAAPMMMISNFEDAQAAAVATGAVLGFGKARVAKAETVELLGQYLPKKAAHAQRV